MSDEKAAEREKLELIEELMGCEHMGDVARIVRKLGSDLGLQLSGMHGDWGLTPGTLSMPRCVTSLPRRSVDAPDHE